MGRTGWRRWDEMGSRVIYAKGEKQKDVQNLSMTRYFRIYRLHRERLPTP